MWRPSFSSIALVVASLALVLAEQIEARDGKQFDKNAIREPLGPTVDTHWPVLIKWDAYTKGTISLKLLKGKSPDGMEECETIADHINNTGIHIWLTGDWLEDSSTMKAGYKYGLKIIDDETGNYNFSPAFDLIVPHSTFIQQNNKPETKGTSYVTDTDDKGNEDENLTLGVGKDHQYHRKPKPHDKGTQPKGSQQEPTSDDDPDFVEPDEAVQKDQKHSSGNNGKPKSSIPDTEEDFVEPDSKITGSTKPPSNGNIITDIKDTILNQDHSTSSASSSKGLPKAAVIGIAVAVVVVVVAIILAIGCWRLTKHKKVMVEKSRSRIGYDGVGDFITKGGSSVLYDGPQMAQYTPRQSIEARYDPPTGQGLPVVGSTPRHSVDTRYDPPSRSIVDTRYDPPSQAPQAHH